MKPEKKQYNAHDLESLEKAFNDSATRVSTIWVSLILFGLYVILAVSGTTHRALFLESPLKLPALNIDLPLIGFFVSTPLLFACFHIFVMAQILLLSHTARTYLEELNAQVKALKSVETAKQRLANTIFAQILAGGERERKGNLGLLLKIIMGLSLLILPFFTLFSIQLAFLPYHSGNITCLHRGVLVLDVLLSLSLWSAIMKQNSELIFWGWKRLSFTYLSLLFALFFHFPGEKKLTLFAVWGEDERQLLEICEVNYKEDLWGDIERLVTNRNRLNLANEFFVKDEEFDKIKTRYIDEKGELKGEKNLYAAERMGKFRNRDLRCGDFRNTNLRLMDFTGAKLGGSNFNQADLEGSDFYGAEMVQSNLLNANLTYASLQKANLSAAWLGGVNWAQSNLNLVYMNGASIPLGETGLPQQIKVESNYMRANGAYFNGISFFSIEKQKKNMPKNDESKKLEGDFQASSLQNIDFSNLSLSINLYSAFINTVNLGSEKFVLRHNKIHYGTTFNNVNFHNTVFTHCEKSFFIQPRLDNEKFVINDFDIDFEKQTNPPAIKPTMTQQEIEAQKNFQNCLNIPKMTLSQHRENVAKALIELSCKRQRPNRYMVEGIVAFRIGKFKEDFLLIFQHSIAKALLEDSCAVKPHLRKNTIKRLQEIVASEPIDNDWARYENLGIYNEWDD